MDFYSEARIQNWIKKINDTRVSEEDPASLLVFDQMLEDVIVACFSILNAVKEREIKKADAIKEVEKISDLFSKKYELNSDLKTDIFYLTAEAIKAVLASFRYYLEGKISKKEIRELLREAFENERKGKLDLAFDAIAKIGAKVIKGEALPEINLTEDSAILSWFDGVDAIAMMVELSKIDFSKGDDSEE